MKNRILISLGLASVVALATAGCSKKDEPVTAPKPDAGSASSASPAASQVIEKAVATSEAQTEVVKAKAQEVTTNLQATATAASSKAQTLIDQARVLVGQSKWSEALNILNQLSTPDLSPGQQGLVQSLKDQALKGVQSATAANIGGEATKAVGGLLPK